MNQVIRNHRISYATGISDMLELYDIKSVLSINIMMLTAILIPTHYMYLYT